VNRVQLRCGAKPRREIKMRVLVLDDTEKHRQSAEILLADHDLTIVKSYFDAELELRGDVYDAFLGDLNVSAPTHILTDPDAYAGVEMPIGNMLAFVALKFGVKLVAILTDKNRHAHPYAGTFDAFGYRPFKVGDRYVLFGDDKFTAFFDEKTGAYVPQSFLDSDEGKKKYPSLAYPNHKSHQGLVTAKDWGMALIKLVEFQKN
jgi:hypothetical protein